MEELFEISDKIIQNTPLTFKRSLYDKIDLSQRAILVKGARGVGKTTLLLQLIKEHFGTNTNQVLYASLDNLWFAENRLMDLARFFAQRGGHTLFLDEVHKYPNWSKEIKNIYDSYPELKIIFTSSSLLQVYRGNADLSRRVISVHLNGLSYREYLSMRYNIHFPIFSLDDILKNHTEIARDIIVKIKPLQYFSEYLKTGYYPFWIEGETFYQQRIRNVVNLILETDLPALEKIDYAHIIKLKRLLSVISDAVPFKPNISKLAALTGVHRNYLIEYLGYLHQSELISSLHKQSYGISRMRKPDKLYLNNTNLSYAIVKQSPNIGTMRETFFYNQINEVAEVSYSDKGDFLIDETYTFEVGGDYKTKKQIAHTDHGFIVSDNIEIGIYNKIPLWLFGFLY